MTDPTSPAFDQWFGASKVVDEKGVPLTVYHSGTADFSRFKRAAHDLGFHFGTAGQAEDRFLEKKSQDPYGDVLRGIQRCTMPVFLSIASPLRMKDAISWNVDSVKASLPKEFSREEFRGLKTCAQLRDLIQSHGYDGIVYANTVEAPGAYALRKERSSAALNVRIKWGVERPGDCSEEQKGSAEYIAWSASNDRLLAHLKAHQADSWIAFEPGQVKSSIGNHGTYHVKDPDITDNKARLKAAQNALAFLSSQTVFSPRPQGAKP